MARNLSLLSILLSAVVFMISTEMCEAVSCSRPTVGQWVTGVDGHECVALIKEKCTGMKSRATTSWTRGIHVKSNCNQIPSLTAIATFAGPGNRYNGGSYQHAAIFIRCASDGVEVYDQWNSSGGVRQRVLRYSSTGVNNGENFYTII